MRNFISENPDWGFHGEMRNNQGIDPAEAFDLACRMIDSATGCGAFETAAWLDSRHGRHFGDDVSSAITEGKTLPEAIEAAISRWRSWKIDKTLAREIGIPETTPYLDAEIVNFSSRTA